MIDGLFRKLGPSSGKCSVCGSHISVNPPMPCQSCQMKEQFSKMERTNPDDLLDGSLKSKLNFLRLSGIFYYDKLDELDLDEDIKFLRMINLNDTFWWASAYCEYVEDDEIEEVYRLMIDYGWCGILYWTAKKGKIEPEFNNVRRMISFVENEEKIKGKCKSSSDYAYSDDKYLIP